MEHEHNGILGKEDIPANQREKKLSRLATFRRDLNDTDFRRKFFYTMGIYLASLAGGWIIGIKGPAFLDLQQLVGVGTSKGAAFFTAAGVGGVVGSLVGGALYDRFNQYLVLFVSMLLYGVTCALIPLCRAYWLMVFMFLLHEMSTGAVRSGSNVEILNVWGAGASKPYMQGLHFAFSVGAAVSPLSLEPFLTARRPTRNVTVVNATFSGTSAINTTVSTQSADPESKILYGFLIAAAIGCLSSFVFLVKFITMVKPGQNSYEVNPRKEEIEMTSEETTITDKNTCVAVGMKNNSSAANDEKQNDVQMATKRPVPKYVIIGAVALFFALYFFLDEVEDTTPSFMAIFVVKQFRWSKKYGTRVTSAFFAAYCAGRGVGMLIIGFLTHIQLFSICSVLLILGHVCLFLSGWFLWGWGLWLGVIIIGLAISVIFPASLTWTEKELTHLSGKLVGSVYIALYAGGLVNPQVIGVTMEMYSPMWYSYVLLTETVCFVVVFVFLVLYVRKVIHKYKRPTETK